ncbi:sulfurtransferase TusA family protein [Shewanella colwelliana]|uniref:Transcriptional regulator n=1 Tax=Shewanella colwelliana TaxID=23 RepID=A0ABQ4NU34_SHECO|nr:sulfurtransferase TusA family protein [Shewanella colwelliana]MCZ4338028.1 sulfurtransferase TusA family protein [Shewanella colwelliana]GIU34526.1 transcriptional regulator [Shewanella colwelliana]GIU34681.1 transcriptional regulator [Shewanella colwelliana]
MTFIDLTAYRCPLALVKLKLALKALDDMERAQISLADAGSRRDVPRFLTKAQYQFQELRNDEQMLVLAVVKTTNA